MVRVHLVVEGQTEETFVRKVLAPYLGSCRVFVDARSVETSRHHSKVYRGGVLDYGRVRRDLERWMQAPADGATLNESVLGRGAADALQDATLRGARLAPSALLVPRSRLGR